MPVTYSPLRPCPALDPFAQPSPGQGPQESCVGPVLSRLKLALLEEYKGERNGCDPYDTARKPVRDAWDRIRKRA